MSAIRISTCYTHIAQDPAIVKGRLTPTPPRLQVYKMHPGQNEIVFGEFPGLWIWRVAGEINAATAGALADHWSAHRRSD